MRGCGPGRGASAAYQAGSTPYYTNVRQLALTRAVAMARQRALWESVRGRARLEAAEEAYKKGDMLVAARFYASLARSRPTSAYTDRAKSRLNDLAEEARRKLAEIDERLHERLDEMSAGDFYTEAAWPVGWQQAVMTAFQQYDQIAQDYGAVPAVKRELRSHVAKQRRRPEYAAALHEAEAATLWQLAQQHETAGQACCAFWVYDKASRLQPAPSAQRAKVRLTSMKQDPRIVDAATACRQLQRCHRTYNVADKLADVAPDRARDLFIQIVELAPADTQIHRAAQSRLDAMSP